MIKTRKQMYLVIAIFLLIILLGTTTYAFFNYTRTGVSNTIRVGRISFVSRQQQTITLTNLFPIDPTEQGIMDDSTKVGTLEIEIEGDTDYVDGVEYLISTTDTNITTSQNNIIPITLDISVEDLGTENDNYFTARESKNANIYKVLVQNTLEGNQNILVGYIKPNTTSGTIEGVDGSITIKAYIDKNNIAITDTPDENSEWQNGRTVISTTEWNSLSSSGLSFKVKVEANEGIWVTETNTLYAIMQEKTVMDNINSTYVNNQTPGIDFGATSGDTNGKGVYTIASTENDTYPIMYYRGNVNDNNVMFANKCWKAVRTTDTGGVKLIYNGEPKSIMTALEENKYNIISNTGATFTYDSSHSEWVTTGDINITFSVLEAGNYTLDYYIPTNGPYTVTRNSVSISTGSGHQSIVLQNVTSSDEFAITYTQMSSGANASEFSMKKEPENATLGCDNDGNDTLIVLNENNEAVSSFKYNLDDSGTKKYSPIYVGYMYGNDKYITPDPITVSINSWVSNAKFGTGFTWNGTNYTLTNTRTDKNATHHYSCNSANENATCTTLRYVYNSFYYKELTNGDGIEEAIVKMQTNTNDSIAKSKIDTWYEENLLDYTNKLEDTIWCNDRSFGNGNNNGWIPNGGDLDTYIYYGAYQRGYNATSGSSVKNQPTLTCPNQNDAFTVNDTTNGNGALTYPIAMLTADEAVYAGSINNFSVSNNSYLNSGTYFLLSPYYSDTFNNYIFYISTNQLSSVETSVIDAGIRPAISLKAGTVVLSGTGTVNDPYIIN